MLNDQPKRSVWPTIFVGLVLLLTAYGGAYWWLVEPGGWTIRSDRPSRAAMYPHPALARFFAPAEWLDRQMRPRFWEPRGLLFVF